MHMKLNRLISLLNVFDQIAICLVKLNLIISKKIRYMHYKVMKYSDFIIHFGMFC